MAQGPFSPVYGGTAVGGASGGGFFGGLGDSIAGSIGSSIGGGIGGAISRAFGGGSKGLSAHDALVHGDRWRFRAERNWKKQAQVAVADLRKAGLNPILAASKGFSAANLPNLQTNQQSDQASRSAAKAADRAASAQLQLATNQSAKVLAEKRLLDAKTKETLASEDLKRGQKGKIFHEVNQLKAMANQLKDLSAKHQQDIQESIKRMPAIDQKRLLDKANEAVRKEDFQIVRIHLQRMKAAEKIYKHEHASWLRLFQEIFGTANIGYSYSERR